MNHHINRIINSVSKEIGSASEIHSLSKKKKGISLYSKKVKTELPDEYLPTKDEFS